MVNNNNNNFNEMQMNSKFQIDIKLHEHREEKMLNMYEREWRITMASMTQKKKILRQRENKIQMQFWNAVKSVEQMKNVRCESKEK